MLHGIRQKPATVAVGSRPAKRSLTSSSPYADGRPIVALECRRGDQPPRFTASSE